MASITPLRRRESATTTNSSTMHVVLVGNPGVGKSSILNAIVGDIKFPSGISIGSGITSTLATHKADATTFYDTPGLDDISMRERAAVEISKAFSQGGEYKLVFVCTLEDGRLKPADLVTADIVLSALEQAGGKVRGNYSVLINKCNSGEMESLRSVRNKDKLLLAFSTRKRLEHLECFPVVPEAAGKTNVLQEGRPYRSFLDQVPKFQLPVGAAVSLDVTDYEKAKEELEMQLAGVRSTVSQLQERQDLRRSQGSSEITEEDVILFLKTLAGFGDEIDDLAFSELKDKLHKVAVEMGFGLINRLLNLALNQPLEGI